MFYWGQNWAFSSTGNFMDNDMDADIYIETNTSALSNVSMLNSELYTTARVSPLSLTYYGLCLMNGNYTVKLHFAEIIFTNDRSFNSLGRRIFNVYIQVSKLDYAPNEKETLSCVHFKQTSTILTIFFNKGQVGTGKFQYRR